MARRTQPPAARALGNPTPVPTDDLHFGPRNPRLAGRGLTVDDQDEILKILWREMAVDEVAYSIAATGYWEHEVLFAAREDGHLLVVEGNRRLAAVKLLRDDGLRRTVGATSLPEIDAGLAGRLASLPAVECSRKEIWQYVGFKHVNGPQDWDSIAKARYVARVHNDYGVPLREIASTIGDRHDTVLRMYRGLMVLQQAKNKGVFDPEDRYKKRFAYSHLWTGIGYTNIQTFLGLTPECMTDPVPNPVPRAKLGNLGELCLWLYGSKAESIEPIVRSQNPDLRVLDKVLSEQKGVDALRAGLPLDTSLKASKGDHQLFREALAASKASVQDAKALVVTGYSGQRELLDAAAGIRDIAISVHDEMLRSDEARAKRQSKKKARKKTKSKARRKKKERRP